MEQDAAQLLKCLNTHKHLYSVLLEKCEEKRRAVIADDVSALESIISEEQELIKQIEAVEGLRIKCSQAMAARLKIDGEITHDKLMEHDKEAKKEFGNISSEIKKLLARLKDLNSVNSALIQKRLAYIEDIRSVFFENQGNNYGSDGKGNENKIQNMNLFDRMV